MIRATRPSRIDAEQNGGRRGVMAIRFVDENGYRGISAEAAIAKRKLKKNRPSWLVSK